MLWYKYIIYLYIIYDVYTILYCMAEIGEMFSINKS